MFKGLKGNITPSVRAAENFFKLNKAKFFELNKVKFWVGMASN